MPASKGTEKTAEGNSEFLEYKGIPLVRNGNTIYYGNMSDPCVLVLTIKDSKDVEDIKVSENVMIQLLSTDDTLPPTERVLKKSEKQGLFNALDLGSVWLERELKKSK